MIRSQKNILWFRQISIKDILLVGGKNASIGEMFSKLSAKGINPVRGQRGLAGVQTKQTSNRVNIPDGFCLTSSTYWRFLAENSIDKKLKELFKNFRPESIKSLQETGRTARALIMNGQFPKSIELEIIKNYKKLSEKYKEENTSVAVRSSATAEDLPGASFAGQHETFLNICGEKELLIAVKKCIASLFTNRAIIYREEKGFKHLEIALSVTIQKMVRSDIASSGVIFTMDTETGFNNVVLINSIYGVGEMIVKGKITPDEFFVFKPSLQQGYKSIIVKNLGRKNKKYIYNKKHGLKEVAVSSDKQLKFSLSDDEILCLAKWACLIEKHYKSPQDIEWAKDGKTGDLFIVQSRPETVHFSKGARLLSKEPSWFEEYKLDTKKEPILKGIAIGDKISAGKVCLISDVSKISRFKNGEVLVTKMTDPDWLPIMRLASAIVTEEGSKTCHAAIVARELGVPCIVGVERATKVLRPGQEITVDCAQGLRGRIFEGRIAFKIQRYNLKKLPKLKTKILLNIGTPEIAFKSSFLPNDGVGLAREEFIIAEKIRVHPLALYHYNKIKDKSLKKKIDEITVEHKDKREYFVKELAEGVGQIAAAFWPKPVIVRFSDFKTNEYRQLIGGELFEPENESNPMLGWRGASRYYDPRFKPAFLMECEAIKRARDVFGLKNIKVMVPFCRTIEEGQKVLDLMKKAGLEKGKDGLEVFVMAELPSNVILAKEFLKIFDGMSIGSNDLTQLSLGLDRDNAGIAHIGDERNEAIKKMILSVISICKKKNKYCGICGQAPSDFPEFAKFLIKNGIESISLNPDSVIKTILTLSKN